MFATGTNGRGRNGRNGRNGRRNGRNNKNGLGNSGSSGGRSGNLEGVNGKAYVRVRRADPTQLYKYCKGTGSECPEDVINKFEHKTPADKILIYGSSGVYFGNLGIGTGRGGGGVTFGAPAWAGRPGLPTGAVGPRDIFPIGSEGYGGHNIPYERPFEGFGVQSGVRPQPTFPSSVPSEEIPLLPMGPDTTVTTDISGGTGVIETTFTQDPSLIPEAPPPDVPPFDSGSTEITTVPGRFDYGGGGIDTAIIEQTPHPDPVNEVVSRTQYSNPTFEVEISTPVSGETSAADQIVVGAERGGVSVGESGEWIPLQEFSSRDTVVAPGRAAEETEFMTSTPERPVRERMGIQPYSRRLQQVRLSEPATLILAENPAFQRDVTVIFEDDLAEIARGNLDFEDLTRLGRPHYQRRPTGLRVSRIGARRGTVHTRSGVEIGSSAHFYTDLSPIAPVEPIDEIEMDILGEQSGEATIISGGDRGHSVNVDLTALGDNIDNEMQESNLLEEGDEDEVATNLQLVFSTGGEEVEMVTVPISTGSIDKPPTVIFGDDGDHIHYPGPDADRPVIPAYPDVTPRVLIDVFGPGYDFSLHPSLLRRKCKRRHKCIYY